MVDLLLTGRDLPERQQDTLLHVLADGRRPVAGDAADDRTDQARVAAGQLINGGASETALGHAFSIASSAPALALLDESGRYRPQAELDDMFACDQDTRVITYSGGGIAASSDAFILTRLGFPDVAVYMGSPQEWAADPANPMEVGAP